MLGTEGDRRGGSEATGQRTSCDSLNLADSSRPSDTRRSDLGLIESVAELGVEGGGSREEEEWEGVDDRGTSFRRDRAISMLTCHEKRLMDRFTPCRRRPLSSPN